MHCTLTDICANSSTLQHKDENRERDGAVVKALPLDQALVRLELVYAMLSVLLALVSFSGDTGGGERISNSLALYTYRYKLMG